MRAGFNEKLIGNTRERVHRVVKTRDSRCLPHRLSRQLAGGNKLTANKQVGKKMGGIGNMQAVHDKDDRIGSDPTAARDAGTSDEGVQVGLKRQKFQ